MTKNHDQAIDKYEDDLLGRQNFVKNLAKSIEQYSGKDSFVIGLYGEWGTGKTSIINMLVDYLQDPKNQTSQEHYKSPIIVKFNPWYFSGQEHLIRQFFSVLSSNLDSSIKKMGQELNDGLNNVGKSMKKFAEILEPVNKFVIPFIPVPLLGETTEGLQKLMDSVSSAIIGDGEESSIDPIKLKENISEQLRDIDKKILIIIDDIDRLNKNEIKQIFQLVKSLADFPNTIYLLSFSPEVVTQSLEEVQGGDSRKYLEKIVQYPIEIPLISQSYLEKFLYFEINKIVKTKNLDQNLYEKRWLEYIFNTLNLRFYFTNIREVTRFLNIFKFNFDLIGEEVNTLDLLIVSAVQSLDTKLYSFLKNNKERFVGGKDKKHQNNLDRSKWIDASSQDSKELENKLLNGISLLENNKLFYRQYDYIKPSLNFLFGQLENVTNSKQSESLIPKTVGERRSIGHIDYFDYYFQLSLPNDKISYLEINQLLNLVDNPDQFLERLENYKNSDKLSSLIDELKININRLFLDDQSNRCKLLHKLIVFYDELDSERIDCVISGKVYRVISEIVQNSCFGDYETKYLSILKELFNISQSHLSFSYLLLLDKFANTFSLYQENYKRDIDRINEYKYANNFIQLENMMLDKIKTNVENHKIFESKGFLAFRHFWEECENQEITQQVTDLINSDKHCFLKFLIICYFCNEKPDKTFLNRFISDQNCLKQISSIKEDKFYWDSLDQLEKQTIDKAYSVIFNSNDN